MFKTDDRVKVKGVCADCGTPHNRDVRASLCRPCAKKRRSRSASQWQTRNPDYVRERNRRKRLRDPDYIGPKHGGFRERVRLLKEATGCADCGQHFPACCLDFDHTGEDKSDIVSKLVQTASAWGVIEAEIRKCELVCACCHRIRTRKRILERRKLRAV